MNDDALLKTCEEFVPLPTSPPHAEDQLIMSSHFIKDPIDADKKIIDSVEKLVDAKSVESAIEKNGKAFNESVHQAYNKEKRCPTVNNS